MSSQESVGESRVSHPTPGPGANSDADHFGPSTEEEMEADLKGWMPWRRIKKLPLVFNLDS